MDGHQDMKLSGDQVSNMQQLLCRRGGGAAETVEPASAPSAVLECQSGRGRMIDIRHTCVLVGLEPQSRFV